MPLFFLLFIFYAMSIGTGLGCGVYKNGLTLVSDLSVNALGSAIGGIELMTLTTQNYFVPGTGIIDVEASRKNGVLTLRSNEQSMVLSNTGFGLGNVAISWSLDAWKAFVVRNPRFKKDPGYVLRSYETHQVHESAHVGQQRVFGVIASVDLMLEQMISGHYESRALLGFERDAHHHSSEEYRKKKRSDYWALQLNRWEW